MAVTVAAVPAAARRLRRAETVAWITRSAPSAALRALGNRAVHVFQPTPEAMVLLVGPEHLDLDALQAAWQRATPW